MIIKERIQALRNEMKAMDIDAYIITGSDPHQGEYAASRWRTREWISGFTGSAGKVVVTRDKAGLWTDSRYYLQAEQELVGSGIQLFKEGLPGVPDISAWLGDQLFDGAVLGCDAETVSLTERDFFRQKLMAAGISCRELHDLLDRIWDNRPEVPREAVIEIPLEYVGKTRREKIADLRKHMQDSGADWFLLNSLDDIAWLLNLRGGDIPYNPLFYAFLLAGKDEMHLFIHENKISGELLDSIQKDCRLHPYTAVNDQLSQIEDGSSVLLDPDKVCVSLYRSIPDSCSIKRERNCSADMKARKNPTELEHMERVHVQDGTALVRFLYCLDNRMAQDSDKDRASRKPETEITLAEKLLSFRKEEEGFRGESFSPIFAFSDHGPMCHYSASEASAYPIQGQGLMIMDTGGQYWGGTTDVTRTLLFGKASQEQKHDYTLVLKGHIALADAVFPEDTRGYHIDAFARAALWREGKRYSHGTGHGVGFMLNVHEGPQNISRKAVDVPLQAGMVVSNEPGLYLTGRYGIRIENLIYVVPAEDLASEEFGQFFRFENLTLCPLERELIDLSILSDEEIAWVDAYHEKVFEKIAPRLELEEREWLRKKTQPLRHQKKLNRK